MIRPVSACLFLSLLAPAAQFRAKPRLDTCFRLMYEVHFDQARTEILAYEKDQPADPLGPAAEAASHLFQEFNRQGVLSSDFFLDDERLLGGISGKADNGRRAAFLESNGRARKMAAGRLKEAPQDPDSLLALTLADGMEADFDALIAGRQLDSLRLIRRAEEEAARLLVVQPEAGDAYLALGAANYILGCLPAYKRFLLWFGGYHGDRKRGMDQLQQAADRGHYLQPLAKVMLALAARRERQDDRARALFEELSREFPGNPVFAHELALLAKR